MFSVSADTLPNWKGRQSTWFLGTAWIPDKRFLRQKPAASSISEQVIDIGQRAYSPWSYEHPSDAINRCWLFFIFKVPCFTAPFSLVSIWCRKSLILLSRSVDHNYSGVDCTWCRKTRNSWVLPCTLVHCWHLQGICRRSGVSPACHVIEKMVRSDGYQPCLSFALFPSGLPGAVVLNLGFEFLSSRPLLPRTWHFQKISSQ